MAGKALTTEGLRSILFQTIADLRDGKIDCRKASAIAKLSQEMIKTADLEIRYTEHLLKVDGQRSESGIAPGPMLLTTDEDKS